MLGRERPVRERSVLCGSRGRESVREMYRWGKMGESEGMRMGGKEQVHPKAYSNLISPLLPLRHYYF